MKKNPYGTGQPLQINMLEATVQAFIEDVLRQIKNQICQTFDNWPAFTETNVTANVEDFKLFSKLLQRNNKIMSILTISYTWFIF